MRGGRSNASGSTIPKRSSPANSTRPMDGLPKRRTIFGTVLAAVLVAGIYVFGCEPRYGGRLVTPAARPLLFAHRGFGDLGPDNSLYAVERALAAGMDGVDV